MTKGLLFIALFLGLSQVTVAQNNLDCVTLCTVEKIVYHDAYLGVQFGSPCDKEAKTDKGVIILKVIDKTAAKDAGLKNYDLILEVNALEVNGRGAVMNAIKAFNPFDIVTFKINRNGKIFTKAITLGFKSSTIIEETICCKTENVTLTEENVTLFPNPAVSTLNIAFDFVMQDDYVFEVYMANGILVNRFNKRFAKGSLKQSIAVNTMEDGVYILKISNGKSTISKLFVVGRN